MSDTPLTGIDQGLASEALDDAPDFANAAGTKRVHDWRSYVGERVAALWSTLPPELRLAIADDAQAIADREDWD